MKSFLKAVLKIFFKKIYFYAKTQRKRPFKDGNLKLTGYQL